MAYITTLNADAPNNIKLVAWHEKYHETIVDYNKSDYDDGKTVTELFGGLLLECPYGIWYREDMTIQEVVEGFWRIYADIEDATNVISEKIANSAIENEEIWKLYQKCCANAFMTLQSQEIEINTIGQPITKVNYC